MHIALSPARRRLLDALHQPRSATQVADVVGMTRQQANYHLRVLESAGLVELVETRQRRGCTERILRATAGAFVVDPAVMQPAGTAPHRDRHAAEHLVATAGRRARRHADAGRRGWRSPAAHVHDRGRHRLPRPRRRRGVHDRARRRGGDDRPPLPRPRRAALPRRRRRPPRPAPAPEEESHDRTERDCRIEVTLPAPDRRRLAGLPRPDLIRRAGSAGSTTASTPRSA